ncbi:hypothetical protein TELCIR_09661 [Teladorsagia circumcincta]|uniref:Uncharacterized protein n=1 Tax=Teladorsagia circumcincta TaxID=45464 RepID=A0A2G9UFQ5_TELCI|nr:hypothetical protein TELCIR_09661 [Teladorsagia circumcincta]
MHIAFERHLGVPSSIAASAILIIVNISFIYSHHQWSAAVNVSVVEFQRILIKVKARCWCSGMLLGARRKGDEEQRGPSTLTGAGEKEKQNGIAKGAGHLLDFESPDHCRHLLIRLAKLRESQLSDVVLVTKLLKHVRLPLCSPEFLVNTVSDNLLISEDVDCRDLVDEAKIGDAP